MMNEAKNEMALVEVNQSKNGIRRELWDLTDYTWKIVTIDTHTAAFDGEFDSSVLLIDGDREGALNLFRDLCATY